jgi:thiol-disulfide isomerase/thioredoxin
MKTFFRILFLIACVAIAARGEIPTGWTTNYSSAFAEAMGSKEPVIVFFTASWCGPCKMMARTTLTNDSVRQALSEMPHVAVDIDEHQDLAAKHGISAVPTFLLMSETGAEIRRTTGFQSASDFVRWVTNGVSEAQAEVARRAEFRKKIATVDEFIASGEGDSFPHAATLLFELCGDRDETIVRATDQRLKTIAAHEPSALLYGLNDFRLATRIQVANVLRERLGDKFEFDPWAGLDERAKVIHQWDAKLAAKENIEHP